MELEKFLEEFDSVINVSGIEKQLGISPRTLHLYKYQDKKLPSRHRGRIIDFFKRMGKGIDKLT